MRFPSHDLEVTVYDAYSGFLAFDGRLTIWIRHGHGRERAAYRGEADWLTGTVLFFRTHGTHRIAILACNMYGVEPVFVEYDPVARKLDSAPDGSEVRTELSWSYMGEQPYGCFPRSKDPLLWPCCQSQ